MDEVEKRTRRCCFTGHRPEKLHSSERLIKIALAKEIWIAYQEGFRTFITGMARGVDIWAGELILRLRSSHQDVRLICALPHPDFEKSWDTEWQDRYNVIRDQADYEATICESISKYAYQRRNEWMVDHSARVIAVYNGTKGGTRNTIEYAVKNNVNICYATGWEAIPLKESKSHRTVFYLDSLVKK